MTNIETISIYKFVEKDSNGITQVWTADLYDLLASGVITGYFDKPGTRKELHGQPKITGFLGPMYDGTDETGTPVIRYETSEVYSEMSLEVS